MINQRVCKRETKKTGKKEQKTKRLVKTKKNKNKNWAKTKKDQKQKLSKNKTDKKLKTYKKEKKKIGEKNSPHLKSS